MIRICITLLTALCIVPQWAHIQNEKKPVAAAIPAAPAIDAVWGTQGDAANSNQVVLEQAGYANGLSYPLIKGAEFGKGGSSVCWLHVPDAKDWVLVNINHTIPQAYLIEGKKCLVEPGVLSYVNCYPLNPAYTLPAGLFFWYNDFESAGNPTPGAPGAFPVRTHPSKEAYMWDDSIKTYVNRVTNEPYKPMINRHPDDRAVRRWMYHDIVDVNKVFERTMCISEEEFRKKLGLRIKTDPAKKKSLYKKRAPRDSGRILKTFNSVLQTLPEHTQKLFAPGFETNFQAPSIGSLRSAYRSHILSGAHKNGRFVVIEKAEFDKQRKGYAVDIRYLQSHFPGAVFQVASTFGSTERGARVYENPLNNMNEKPARGDMAVLGTIVGAIVRRYVIDVADKNLLYGLRNVLVGADHSREPYIGGIVNNMSYDQLVKSLSVTDLPEKTSQSQALELALSGAIRVGVHKNLPVTSGSWGKHDILVPLPQELFEGPLARSAPAFNKYIDTPLSVNHVYTSVINLHKDALKDVKVRVIFEQEQFALPKAALRAAYEGTILAAHDLLSSAELPQSHTLETVSAFLNTKKQQPRLFLALIGVGESANEPEWIVTILEQLQALIAASGLQVGFVVWDNPKMAPLLERLQVISRRIQSGNFVELSQAAEKAGELLWLFDADGKLRPKIDKDSALVTLPIKKNNKGISLPIWHAPA